ncbi:MAG: NusG domain II-containing protein [Clostridiales bacterium]|nr:NusG domain II-containing protein [Clostridiales bacterium]
MIIALLLFIFLQVGEGRVSPQTAEIYYQGQFYQKIPLGKDQLIPIGNNLLEIKNGQAVMIAADCPDKVCLKTGPISRQGQLICCLPNQILVRLSGGQEEGLDAITW